MARKKKEETNETTPNMEELENGTRETNTSNSGSGDNEGRKQYTVDSNGTVEFKGNSTTGSEDNPAGEGTNGDKEGSNGDRKGSKTDLLQRIRDKKHKRDIERTSTEHRSVEEQLQGLSGGNEDTHEGNGNEYGTGTRPSNGVTSNERGLTGNNSDANTDSTSSEPSRIKDKKPKVEVGKLPPLPKANVIVDTKPKEEPTLSQKEAKDLKERLKEALRVFFQLTDKGIGLTTKKEEARVVLIWSSIDNDELDVIVTTLLESGQKSKIIAQSVRNITYNYKKLQMGLILAPRFVLSVQHYLHNGFKLPFGGN